MSEFKIGDLIVERRDSHPTLKNGWIVRHWNEYKWAKEYGKAHENSVFHIVGFSECGNYVQYNLDPEAKTGPNISCEFLKKVEPPVKPLINEGWHGDHVKVYKNDEGETGGTVRLKIKKGLYNSDDLWDIIESLTDIVEILED